MKDPGNPAAALARDLATGLKEFHRALVLAEAGDDPALQNPYTLLFALIGDPRFAWAGGLAQLIVRLDETLAEDGISVADDLLPFRDAVAGLLGEGEDENAEFRLRHLILLQKSPEVALATGGLRRLLARLPASGAK